MMLLLFWLDLVTLVCNEMIFELSLIFLITINVLCSYSTLTIDLVVHAKHIIHLL